MSLDPRIKDIVSRFKIARPRTVKDALIDCNVTLTHVGSGAFRDTYAFECLPLVVKFPQVPMSLLEREGLRDEFYRELNANIEHGLIEQTSIKRILKSKRKYKPLHTYMPTTYYFDRKNGVTLMHKYMTPDYSLEWHERCEALDKTAAKIFGDDVDIQPNNCGIDDDGNMVILDLGCFERTGDDGNCGE